MNTAELDAPGFRDRISTVDEDGKRIWLHPKKPSGKWYRYRSVLSWGLLAFLFAGPWLRIQGEPLLLLNVVERKFVVLGQVFWPHDLYLFLLATLIFIVFIILFTVVFGRLFCGWVCPQTIFMEMLFRKIEYALEGDYMAQRALDKKPWNAEKIMKRGTKHLLFFILSVLIANTFLAYIIGSESVVGLITDGPQAHVGGFVAMLIFSALFYGVFAQFREQVCTGVCPYGRLQGVLLDRNSVAVTYDHVRGESRGKMRKGQDRAELGLGDCIDCFQCVAVCPTGIDIRNGTQLECTNCTACIDACNTIMEKVGQPRGLVRYASEASIADGKAWKITRRAVAYSIVLVGLLVAMGSVLYLRTDVETKLLRTPGMTFQTREDGRISNLYNVKMLNKTNEAMDLKFALLNWPEGEIQWVGEGITRVESQEAAEGTLFIILPYERLAPMKNRLEVGIYRNGELIEIVKTNFMGPFKGRGAIDEGVRE